MLTNQSATTNMSGTPSNQSPLKASAADMLRLEMLTSLKKYTKAMFKAQYKRAFAMGEHHDKLFEVLEKVVDGEITRLIINMPPRYSKTEVVVKSFISWCYALNASCRFLHLSYSDMLVNDNSATVRNIMQEPLYQQLFPNSALAKDKESSTRWKTKAGGEMYSVSTQGQVTGFGAGKVDNEDDPMVDVNKLWAANNDEFTRMLGLLEVSTNVFEGAIVIDDPTKPEDAMSDTIRERINTRFETTIRNRTNSRRTPIIIIMQRLHEHDLCGYLMEVEPDEWVVLSLPAIIVDEETGEERPLWELKHTLEELHKVRKLNPLVFDTQYMQDPKPKEGLMYSNGFGTYTKEVLHMLTGKSIKRLNYTDTADTGADKLCSINFIDTPEYCYVIDVLFTDKPMEVTEPQMAIFLSSSNIEMAKIEGNNGGRGFARNVQRIARTVHRNFRTRFTTFHQTANKFVRIFSRSAEVQNIILMPEGWDRKWPEFYAAVTSYRKDNKRKSQHDDAADTLTGVAEMHGSISLAKKPKRRN